MADMRGGGLYFVWTWPAEVAFGISSLEIDLGILNNPMTSDVLFFSTQLFCGTPNLRNTFYFGPQTNVQGQGKGIIFSRFGTNDLANAETAGTSDSWSVSSGSEGGFIGVRRLYDWTDGHYKLRLESIRDDSEGRWFGIWIIDQGSRAETYGGALRFPKDSTGQYPNVMTEGFGSFIEHATSVPTPALVPLWDLTIGRPTANRTAYAAKTASWRYALPTEAWQNSDIWVEGEFIKARMGADTQRIHGASQLTYSQEWILPKY